MGIEKIPGECFDYQRFIDNYEEREMVPNEHSRNVSDATIRIMQGWLPSFLHGLVQPLAACLAQPRFLEAVGYDRPSWIFRWIVSSTLKTRRVLKRFVCLDAFPDLLAKQFYRTYPADDYDIETLGPVYYTPVRSKEKQQ